MRRATISSLRLAVAILGIFSSDLAHADEAADTAAARILGGDGVLLADAGNCVQAIDKLSRAESLHHAPTTAARLGECEIAVGKLVAGTERLQRVVREPLASGASPASLAAVVRARSVLEQALPRIPTIRVSVVAPAGTAFAVTLDGEAVPEAILGSDRPADPRTHTIQVTANGFLTASKEFSLNDGESKRVSLDLEPDPTARPILPSRVPAHLHARSSSRSSAPSRTAAFVALGISALGLGAGVGGGIAVASQSSDLSRACGPNRICPPDKQSEIASAKSWATVSTVGFAVGGAALGAAAVLFFSGGQESHAATMSAEIGPSYVGLTGSF